MVANFFWNALCHSYNVAFHYREMGGRKFKLGVYRKKKERRKSENSSLTVSLPIALYFNRPAEVISPGMVVSLPVSAYTHAPAESHEVLLARLSRLQLPPSWVATEADPLLLCKLASHETRATVHLSLSICHDFSWAISVGSHGLDCDLFPGVHVPDKFTTAFSLKQFLILLDKMRLCPGNSDEAFLEMWKYHSLTLNASHSKYSSNTYHVCVFYK